MARQWVSDELWREIKPVLPKRPPRPKGGGPADDRACLVGILFVLYTGGGWTQSPAELAPSGPTCWRRVKAGTQAGVWPQLWRKMLRHLGRHAALALPRAVADSAAFRALFGGGHTGPHPTDRGKNGCKRHVIPDAQGVPLALRVTAAHVPDGHRALELLDAIPPVAGAQGRPRFRPAASLADRADGWAVNILGPRRRRVRPYLARPRDDTHGSGLGRFRYVVERPLAWFGHCRRLRFCYEKGPQPLQAFHELAAALICFNKWIASHA